jgi:hypothetical protein
MGQRRLFHRRELALDPVEPGGVCRGELKAYSVGLGPRLHRVGAMRREVVEDDPEAARVAAADGLEKDEKLARALAAPEVPVQLVPAHVVIGEQMADAVGACVGGAKPLGFPFALPGAPGVGPQFQRSELIDANYRFPARLGVFVEPLDGVFFYRTRGRWTPSRSSSAEGRCDVF